MVDLDGFERFIKKRGKVNTFAPPSDALVKAYRDRLPEYVIEVWKTYGFASYAKGLFFVSSPQPFETILETYFGKKHPYTVICHSSFGDLLLWDHENPSIISFDVNAGRGSRMVADGDIDSFFMFGMNDDGFYEVHRYDLHLKAVDKFGQLEPDQVFAFVPALSLGGSEKLENIKVSQLREYLAILADIAVADNKDAANQT
jgi:hypothetical protein